MTFSNRLISQLLFVFFVNIYVGCAPSIFTGDTKNDLNINQPNSTFQCTPIQLQNDRLSVADFKNAIHCMNQDHSLDSFESFVNELSQNTISDLVSYLNENISQHPDKINYWNSLLSDVFLKTLAPLFKNQNFVEGLLGIISQMDDRARNAFYILLTDGDLEQNINSFLEFLIKVTDWESFKEISSAFSKPIHSSKLTLNEMTNNALLYFKAKTNQDADYMSVIWNGILNHSFQKGIQAYFGKDIDMQVQKLNELIEYLHIDQKKDVYPKLRDVFFAFNRSMSCYQSTKSSLNGDMHIFEKLNEVSDEISPTDFVFSEYMKFAITDAVCKIPQQANVFKYVLDGFANDRDGRVLRTSIDFVKAMTIADGKTEKFRRLLIDAMSDRNEYNAVFGLEEPIAEWISSDKRVVENILYFINALMQPEILKDLNAFVKKYIKPRDELGKKSIQESLFDVSKLNANHFFKLVKGISEFSSDTKFELRNTLVSMLKIIRTDSQHEVINVIQSWLRRAVDSKDQIIQLPSFYKAIHLFAEMSENGKLRDFLNNLQKMIGRKSTKIELNIYESTVKQFESKVIHLSTKSQKKWIRPKYKQISILDKCGNVSIGFDYLNANQDQLERQMNSLALCLNAQGKSNELQNLFDSLADIKSNHSGLLIELRNFINTIMKDRVSVDLISDLFFKNINQEQSSALSKMIFDSFENNYSKGSLSELFLKYLQFQRSNLTQNDWNHLISLFSNLVLDEQHNSVDADLLMSLRLHLVQDEKKRIAPTKVIPNLEKVRNDFFSLEYKNNKNTSDAANDYKIQLNDYFNNIQNGNRKKTYQNYDEYLRTIKPLFNRLAEKNLNIAKSLLLFFAKIDSTSFSSSYVNQWLSRTSGNVRAIEYYFENQIPDKDEPTIILVNDLDLLELVARNADFTLNQLGQIGGSIIEDPDTNFAIKYFTELALSENKLSEFVEETNSEFKKYNRWVNLPGSGIIIKPELKRRIVNLNNVLPILSDLVNRKDVRSGVNDLQILQKLFYSTLTVMKSADWNLYNRNTHSLGLIVDLAEAGIFRMFSTSLWIEKNKNSTSVSTERAIQFISELSKSQNTNRILESLLINDPSQSKLNELFKVMYAIHNLSKNEKYNLGENAYKLILKIDLKKDLDSILDILNRSLQFKNEKISNNFDYFRLLKGISNNSIQFYETDLLILRKLFRSLKPDQTLRAVLKWVFMSIESENNSFWDLTEDLKIYLSTHRSEVLLLKNWILNDADSIKIIESVLKAIAVQVNDPNFHEIFDVILRNPSAFCRKFEILATPKLQDDFRALLKELSQGLVDSYP